MRIHCRKDKCCLTRGAGFVLIFEDRGAFGRNLAASDAKVSEGHYRCLAANQLAHDDSGGG
jgi:hypothetical protein